MNTRTGEAGRMPIPVNYVSNLVELVAGAGFDTGALLREAGLTHEEVHAPEARLRFDQFRRVILGARELTGDPGIGLRLGAQLTLTAHGLLGYAAMSSANLGEVIQLLLRYFNTRTRLCTPEFRRDGRRATLLLHERVSLGDVRVPYMEVVTAALVGALRFLVGARFDEGTVSFPWPEPAYGDRYRQVFAMDVAFDAPVVEIAVPSAVLDVPFPMADRASREMAAQKCEEELQRLEAREDAAARVRHRLMTADETLPGIEELARELCMTSRTLRRHLAAAGTSYQQLLDEVRESRACRDLESGLTVQQVAWRLGYRDASNFARAFRRWTGVSPRLYRLRGGRNTRSSV